MSNRYKNVSLNFKNDKSYQGTTLYKKVPLKDTDKYFIAQEGDRCDSLANEFYGNPKLWWFIARVNNIKTMNIPAGTSLRIPLTAEDAEGL